MIGAVFLVACGSGGHEGDGHGGGDQDRPVPVTVVELAAAQAGSVSDVLVANAIVESERAADLFPQATGVVVSVRVDDGDPVRRGDVLAVLDNVSLDAGAERAHADLAQLEREVADLERLRAQGAVSEREVSDAQHRLATARTSAREATVSQGQTKITAPFDGVVALREVRVGELASGGKRAFQVVDLSRLRVVASLPERDLGRVAVGQVARLVSAYDPDREAAGVVHRIAPVIDASSGTFRVTIEVAPGQTSLRPGQFVSVSLVVDRKDAVLTVPRDAVVWEEGRSVAWRVLPAPPEDASKAKAEEPTKPEGGWLASLFGGDAQASGPGEAEPEEEPLPDFVTERVPITVGVVDERFAEITEGLVEGDQVVTVGHANLRDGAHVRTPEIQQEARRRAEAARAKEKEEKAGEEG